MSRALGEHLKHVGDFLEGIGRVTITPNALHITSRHFASLGSAGHISAKAHQKIMPSAGIDYEGPAHHRRKEMPPPLLAPNHFKQEWRLIID